MLARNKENSFFVASPVSIAGQRIIFGPIEQLAAAGQGGFSLNYLIFFLYPQTRPSMDSLA